MFVSAASDDPFIWDQTTEMFLHAPLPSLMRVEFHCIYYTNFLEELSGWKVTKIDGGNITVVERI